MIKQIIAMKHKGGWTQAELSYEEAQTLLKHDTAFEEALMIDGGKLKRIVRPTPDDAETPEAPLNTPQ